MRVELDRRAQTGVLVHPLNLGPKISTGDRKALRANLRHLHISLPKIHT